MIAIALRFVGAGVRSGRFMVGVSLLPARTAWDAAWPALQARGEAAFEAAFDDALAGPLTEHFARSLGEHRVIERVADELIANGTVTALFTRRCRRASPSRSPTGSSRPTCSTAQCCSRSPTGSWPATRCSA